MPIPVTLLYGGLLALLVVGLGSWVSTLRLFTGSRLGKPAAESLFLPIRAHGNAAEWVPLGIALLLMLELSHVPSLWLHVAGGAFLGLRLVHAGYALLKLPYAVGVMFAVLHYGVVGAMAAAAVWLHVHPIG